MKTTFFEIKDKKTAVIATAIHDGHSIKKDLHSYMLLNEFERAREEDPYTGYMIEDLPVSCVTVASSRFQVDLNRVKEKAIYEKPEDAWGLHVWQNMPANKKKELLKEYDDFYNAIKTLLDAALKIHEQVFVLDIHSYNHRRDNAHTTADKNENPEINLGTHYNHAKWANLCNAYAQLLRTQSYHGRNYDARENVKFKGGAFARWIIENYGKKVCVISVEFKKTFMDEWTGIADIPHINCLKKLLDKSVDFFNNNTAKLV